MNKVRADESPYQIILLKNESYEVFPYLRNPNGNKEMFCVSPHHGRSYIVGKTNDGRFVVSKGNGLSYSQYQFIHTGEFGDDTLGLLLKKDAERDFIIGQEIETLGIKTNHMEYVIELLRGITLINNHKVNPILLQYDVECPYRICDAAFMTQEQIQTEVAKWERMNNRGYNKAHMIAANVLISNLRILHGHNILHNAIHEQNYTWALELVDFELACSPAHPYTNEDAMRHVKDLFSREIMQTYVIINYIAGVLREEINFSEVDALFADYGFCLKQYEIIIGNNYRSCQRI